jgi:hypothetical protein
MGCTGKQQWHAVQKFQAGGARLGTHSHGDYLHVLGLVLEAYPGQVFHLDRILSAGSPVVRPR